MRFLTNLSLQKAVIIFFFIIKINKLVLNQELTYK